PQYSKRTIFNVINRNFMRLSMSQLSEKMNKEIEKAVSHYWMTRHFQRKKQKKRGVNDAGLRSAVTGRAQMDGFINLFTNLIIAKTEFI
ncbi:MAG: PaeR7I family type II restriction endonuclease, partial [Desulfatirhabdiaceae bacterium]|nr:PaeR7I family type II restriction endonuclease [Desulfatirhabdiaceae bacterium]